MSYSDDYHHGSMYPDPVFKHERYAFVGQVWFTKVKSTKISFLSTVTNISVDRYASIYRVGQKKVNRRSCFDPVHLINRLGSNLIMNMIKM